MSIDLCIALALFSVGFLYASVGHGGASGYLAVLSLFAVPVATYKPVILMLNILVAGMAFIQFRNQGYFKWKLCWPFLITSLPAAYFGSKLPLQGDLYNLLLGVALIVPVIRLLGLSPAEKGKNEDLSIWIALVLGLIIGFLSGMLNIGGGIFLSPILILLAWATAKEAAAASALFIVLNSIAGLVGHSGEINISNSSLLWFILAAVGGFTGSFFGSRYFHQVTIRYLLTAVLSIACCKLLFFM